MWFQRRGRLRIGQRQAAYRREGHPEDAGSRAGSGGVVWFQRRERRERRGGIGGEKDE